MFVAVDVHAPTEDIALVEAVGGDNCRLSVPLLERQAEGRVGAVRRTGDAQVGLASSVHDAQTGSVVCSAAVVREVRLPELAGVEWPSHSVVVVRLCVCVCGGVW
jgi:hypothetical protein